MSVNITYETLFDILRKESSREDLQALQETFYADVHEFLHDKKEEAKESSRALIEYENIRKIVKELYDRRERKLLLLALNKARTESAIIDPSVLLPEERALFDTLVAALQDNKKTVLQQLASAPDRTVLAAKTVPPKPLSREPVQAATPTASGEVFLQEQVNETDGVRVKFLKAVPKFIGRDMTIFGPFDPGMETNLPEEVANVLLKKGHVEKT